MIYASRFRRVGRGKMQTQGPAQQRAPEAAPSSGEIAEGLMLWRASTLRMIRLQLAMEQGDRRATLETVDELVALDRQLQDYLAPHVPTDLIAELEAERSALNREKLTLAAGVIRRPEPVTEVAETPEDWLGPRDLPELEEPKRSRRWMIALPITGSFIAGAAYALGSPQAQAWLIAAARSLS
ncbi:MAG TPA: hypothetical protein VF067_06880 [Sphingomicrobium sp.]